MPTRQIGVPVVFAQPRAEPTFKFSYRAPAGIARFRSVVENDCAVTVRSQPKFGDSLSVDYSRTMDCKTRSGFLHSWRCPKVAR